MARGATGLRASSRQQRLHHMRLLHPGEPLLEAAEAEGEAGVVDAKEVQDGGVEVADVEAPT